MLIARIHKWHKLRAAISGNELLSRNLTSNSQLRCDFIVSGHRLKTPRPIFQDQEDTVQISKAEVHNLLGPRDTAYYF